MSGLVARRPKGTERSITRWLARTAGFKAGAYELRCVSTAEPYPLERFAPTRTSSPEAFALDVLELAQEDADARGERSEYRVELLAESGEVLATHVVRCLPREPVESEPSADVLRVVLDHQQALMKSYLSMSTTALAEVQRVSSTAIEASRGLVNPLVKRLEAVEAENAELRELARDAQAVVAVAAVEDEGADRAERRTAALEKLAGVVLMHLAKGGDVKAATLINELVGTPPSK